jgi:hypothetical protein
VNAVLRYDAHSHLRYRAGESLPVSLRNASLQLPAKRNPRTAALAQDMRREAGSDEAYIRAVLAMFRQQEFFYTLTPPGLARDSVDDFLFNTRQGFCGHFASAFTTMMRAAGIPARVVAGYQGGDWNPVGGYLLVRQSHAHAWSEVWLPGQGWRRIDPTAAVAPERIERGIEASFAGSDLLPGAFMRDSPLLWKMGMIWDNVTARCRTRSCSTSDSTTRTGALSRPRSASASRSRSSCFSAGSRTNSVRGARTRRSQLTGDSAGASRAAGSNARPARRRAILRSACAGSVPNSGCPHSQSRRLTCACATGLRPPPPT